MAKHRRHTRNIKIKKTPRLHKYKVKMVERVRENAKKKNKRKWHKQNLAKEQDT
jgi:hypothetical protein